jgi:hypothetical protein
MLLRKQAERRIFLFAVRDNNLEEGAFPERLEQECEQVGVPQHRDDHGDQGQGPQWFTVN